MPRMTNQVAFAIAAIVALALFAEPGESQTQEVNFVLSVPVVKQKVHPEIQDLALDCRIAGVPSSAVSSL